MQRRLLGEKRCNLPDTCRAPAPLPSSGLSGLSGTSAALAAPQRLIESKPKVFDSVFSFSVLNILLSEDFRPGSCSISLLAEPARQVPLAARRDGVLLLLREQALPPWAWTTAPGAVAPTGPRRAAWPSMTTRVALWGTASPTTLTLTVPVPACRYFFAMLDDRDRNARYNEAIRACIDDFNRENPELGGPRVLDVGVGTGFLSACCLLAGAKHVTGVDVPMRLELR